MLNSVLNPFLYIFFYIFVSFEKVVLLKCGNYNQMFFSCWSIKYTSISEIHFWYHAFYQSIVLFRDAGYFMHCCLERRKQTGFNNDGCLLDNNKQFKKATPRWCSAGSFIEPYLSNSSAQSATVKRCLLGRI